MQMLIIAIAAAVVSVLLLVYFSICYAHTVAHQRVAALLVELLQTTQWSDIMKLIKNEEYVQAVMDACEMALEG